MHFEWWYYRNFSFYKSKYPIHVKEFPHIFPLAIYKEQFNENTAELDFLG